MRIVEKIFDLSKQKPEEDKYYNGEEPGSGLMRFNKLLGNSKVFTIIFLLGFTFVFLFILYILNSLFSFDLQVLLMGEDPTKDKMSYLETLHMIRWFIPIYFIIGVALYIKTFFRFKMSFEDIAQGLEGTARWASRDEIEAGYKKIPEKNTPYDGPAGPPIARDGEYLYIDPSAVHMLTIGTTRSGKGEEDVFPCIEIYSRSNEKPSMIITDPKMELAPATIKMLEARGYEVHILNLIDPEYSMFFNPLTFIIDEYINGKVEKAQEFITSLAYNIIAPNPEEKDPYWPDQARVVLRAAIIADIEDNIARDKEINERAEKEFKDRVQQKKLAALNELPIAEATLYKVLEEVENIKSRDPEITNLGLMTEIINGYTEGDVRRKVEGLTEAEFTEYIKSEKPKINYIETDNFVPTTENIEKCNLFSIVRMVSLLAGINIEQNQTALDKYFMERPAGSMARVLYSGIYTAAPQTKGTIMSTFNSKIDIFKGVSIGRMTAKNSLNFMDVGFGKKPIAVFIALPDSDKANWFISTVFINQLYTSLVKYATAWPTGRTEKDVLFLLDEFGNLPALDNMESIVSVSLGRGMRFHFIIQGFAQLENKYGRETAQTIKDNCGNWKYLLTTDTNTAKEISDALGEKTVIKVNRSGKRLSLNKERTEMAEKQPLMSPNDLMTKMHMGETIIIRPLKRKDNKGNDQYANPIRNFGKYRMKFRYEYMPELITSGNILYKSDNFERIIANNNDLSVKYTNILEKKILDVKLNRTDRLNEKTVSRDADKWVNRYNYFKTGISTFAEKEANAAKIVKIFDITNYPYEFREKVLSGEETEFQFTVEDYIRYAKMLIKIPKFSNIGFSILDILDPLDYSKYIKEENIESYVPYFEIESDDAYED